MSNIVYARQCSMQYVLKSEYCMNKLNINTVISQQTLYSVNQSALAVLSTSGLSSFSMLAIKITVKLTFTLSKLRKF